MNKTASFLCLCIMILKCVWHFHNAYAKQQVPTSSNYKGRYTSDIKNFEIVFPQRVNKDGNFISHLVQHHHSKRSTNEVQYIFYKIPIKGKDYLIELTPNRKLIAPGAVVEIRKEYTRQSLKRNFFNESNPNDTLQKVFENLEIKKLRNTECHFSGHVKGENISKAAISTCHGLAGFIQIKQGFYTIEPVAGHNSYPEDLYPHILYKEDGLENSSTCHTMGQMAKALLDKVVRKRRESLIKSSEPMFAETLIVLDKTMINRHRDSDCENYVLTVFNMAFNLFRDASVGMLMTLSVVRIIRLEIEDDQTNLKLNESAEKTLRYFQTWQYEINPGDDTHPNHHDIALLLTRLNFCSSPTSCGILGLTTIGKACDPKESAALCEDTGLRLGYVIAHEIGHLLGADHDSVNLTSKRTGSDGWGTVMLPDISVSSKTWSKYSQAYFKEFFKTVENCFLDEPEEHHFNMQDLLPGVMYDANFQCKNLFTLNSRECEMGSTCASLNCHVPGYACIVTHTPPADGTRCGESMWCHNSKCLVIGERPGAVDGNWGEWSAWSDCSRTCGSGVTRSIRNCNKPQPSHGGKNCVGEQKRYKICAATPCETGRPSFRDIQCGEFNDWIYPEDGKIHTWKAYNYHDGNPCVLYCINEEKVVVALRPRVIDGTMCYKGIRDLCVAGTCKSLPCDLNFGSNAIEDVCGVCHGDGTGCEFSQGVQTFSKLTKGLTKLVNVPVGTKNIKVEETSPTLSKIVVRDKDGKDTYIRGKNLGMFSVPGSRAWLGMIKKDQEALHIPGPVSKPLSIWIHRLENVTVKWSMALPTEEQRKPQFTWDFLIWGPCSAECGPGVQKSDPSCTEEKAGLVEDNFCADLQIPAAKVRPCEIEKCIPRWMVGDWKYCDNPNSRRKEKKRAVYCIKKMGEGEGETQIVPDSECKNPKPHSVEPCENRKKRENTEYNYIENNSIYNSDRSEYAFRKSSDDLKYLAPLSVPKKKGGTAPFHPVFFPHFRHDFQVVEKPENKNTTNSVKVDLNINSIGDIMDGIQNNLSSEFHKGTSRREQIGVNHSINTLSVTKGKNLYFENQTTMNKETEQKMLDEMTHRLLGRKGQFRQEKGKTRIVRRTSTLSYQSSPGQTEFLGRKKNPLGRKVILNSKSNKAWNTPLLTSQLRKNSRLEVGAWSKTQRKKFRKSCKEKANIRSCFYPPHTVNEKLRKQKFFIRNFNPSSQRLKRRNWKTSNTGKAGSKNFNFRKGENQISRLSHKERKKHSKSGDKIFFFNFITNTFDTGRNFKRRQRSKALFFEGKRPEIYSKRCFQPEEKNMYSTPTHRKPNKAKRSNWKWKKHTLKDTNAKTTKDSNGNPWGIETRNYLNTLFRENHRRVATHRPQTTTVLDEAPVIQIGKVVIDRDSMENKNMEIFFWHENNDENPEKNNQLPRPPLNEDRLSLTGQEVFDLIQKLQRRSCLYRGSNETAEKPKVEEDVKLPGNLSDKKKLTTADAGKETVTTNKPIKVSTTTMKPYVLNKTTETTQLQPKITTEETNNTTKNDTQEGYPDDSDTEEHYDIDEIIPYPPSVDRTTTEEPKTKKKKKSRKGKYKGPHLEDYDHEFDPGEEQNASSTKPTVRY